MSIIKSTNLVIFLISLLGCGQSSVDLDSSSLPDSDVDKNKLVMIPGHEQLVTLHYDEAFVASACTIINPINLSITTPCSCSAGVCTAGLTPDGLGPGTYSYTVEDGGSSSDQEVVTTDTKEGVPFVSTWRVGDGSFGDGDLTITLPLPSGYNYNFTVDWGDGNTAEVTAHDDVDIDHTYGLAGDYTIKISGLIEAWSFPWTSDRGKIISVSELGHVGWRSLEATFKSCTNLGTVAGGETSNVTSMKQMFDSSANVTPDTSTYNTSNVTDMSVMFRDTNLADPDTSKWDTSKVTTMRQMFDDAGGANPDTSNWDTSKVTDMYRMFYGTTAEPDTSKWNTSSVTNMARMFYMSWADPDTSNWDTSSVTNMENMFYNAYNANPDVSGWDTSNVTDMGFMFAYAEYANPDMSNWDFSSSNDVHMFVGNMSKPVGISTENYDNLLIQLDNTGGSNLTINVDSVQYTSAVSGTARANLVSKGWTVTDGGSI